MTQRLENDDPSNPSMKEVEGIEREVEERNQRVVAASHQEQGNHVNNGQNATPVPQQGGCLGE
jgi:hypothetical protein